MMSEIQVLILSDHAESMTVWTQGLLQQAIPCRSMQIDAIDNSTLEFGACSLMVLEIDGDSDHATEIGEQARLAFDGPILFLTYERDERFHMQMYKVGIDDCIVKPIGMPLLLAKVSSWLRRTVPSHLYDVCKGQVVADFRYDRIRRLLATPDGRSIRLSKLESRLVTCFLKYPGQILASDIVAAHVWTDGCDSNDKLLKNLVYRLRQKIEPEPSRPRYFQTVLGEGYRFAVVAT